MRWQDNKLKIHTQKCSFAHIHLSALGLYIDGRIVLKASRILKNAATNRTQQPLSLSLTGQITAASITASKSNFPYLTGGFLRVWLHMTFIQRAVSAWRALESPALRITAARANTKRRILMASEREYMRCDNGERWCHYAVLGWSSGLIECHLQQITSFRISRPAASS